MWEKVLLEVTFYRIWINDDRVEMEKRLHLNVTNDEELFKSYVVLRKVTTNVRT